MLWFFYRVGREREGFVRFAVIGIFLGVRVVFSRGYWVVRMRFRVGLVDR